MLSSTIYSKFSWWFWRSHPDSSQQKPKHHILCQIKMKTIMHFNQDRSGRPLLHHANTPLPSHIWKGILYVYHNQLLLLLNCSKHITIQFYFTTNCSYYTGEEPVVNFWFSCFVFFFSWLGCHSHSTQPFVLFMLYGREKANTAISSKIF